MHEPPPQPRVPGFAKAKAKAATKKVTTAILSEPLSSLAQSLPAISSQLAALQGRQDKMEALLTSPSLASGRLGKKGELLQNMPSGPLFDGPEEDSDVFGCASHFGRVPRFGDQLFVSFFSLSLCLTVRQRGRSFWQS